VPVLPPLVTTMKHDAPNPPEPCRVFSHDARTQDSAVGPLSLVTTGGQFVEAARAENVDAMPAGMLWTARDGAGLSVSVRFAGLGRVEFEFTDDGDAVARVVADNGDSSCDCRAVDCEWTALARRMLADRFAIGDRRRCVGCGGFESVGSRAVESPVGPWCAACAPSWRSFVAQHGDEVAPAGFDALGRLTGVVLS